MVATGSGRRCRMAITATGRRLRRFCSRMVVVAGRFGGLHGCMAIAARRGRFYRLGRFVIGGGRCRFYWLGRFVVSCRRWFYRLGFYHRLDRFRLDGWFYRLGFDRRRFRRRHACPLDVFLLGNVLAFTEIQVNAFMKFS